MEFNDILKQYRTDSTSTVDKGSKFEILMLSFLKTDPRYSSLFRKVWLWKDFPAKDELGGKDTGIDLVALTHAGDYWAVQCKFYVEQSILDKGAVDSFLSTSSRTFKNEQLQTVGFAHRLWISTTNNWGPNAEEAIKNQSPPVSRLNLYDLQEAPVNWEVLYKGITGDLARKDKKELRSHQQTALKNTHEYFTSHDRGKLIMACGTGKTLTALRIAENETGGKGFVLFLVPSIALIGQTLSEWTANSINPINPVCICSDAKVTKKYSEVDSAEQASAVDLALPASTDVEGIVTQLQELSLNKERGMTVVFSTYHSIDVISKAQKKFIKEKSSLGIFDLVICDEAHRTTGTALLKEDSSSFIKVHDEDFIQAKKRLYMTATPRLYSDDAKSKAEENDSILCSMDDPKIYGDEIYRIGFGEAVERDLLSDYKVLILTLSEDQVPVSIQNAISSKESKISSIDATKIVGCINALSKQIIGDKDIILNSDPEPMKRAVVFCQSIAVSKNITEAFNKAGDVYLESLSGERREKMVAVSSNHIDGSMAAPQRDGFMSWIKSTETDAKECRILTNVRCLSEGVDVPSLDAVMFLSPKNSQVEVVQSVGRVMRKAPGKKYGYIIIPVVVPSDVDPSSALDNNENYKVVWAVLNALRSHDDRFDAIINKINLNKEKPSQIIVAKIGEESESKEVKKDEKTQKIAEQLSLGFQELQGIVFARMVQKVGTKVYWEKWAKDVAEIAERQIQRITHLVNKDDDHKKAFQEFLDGLRKNINPAVTELEAIEMLSQHIVTKPVFEALFENYSFVKNNPISVSMQKMLDLLEAQAVEGEAEALNKFYESVRKKARGIDNAEGKQKIIVELYDKFFKTAFPKMVEKLGIVYTPVEVVDFIIHSVNDVLKKEFDRSLSDENIHILDPFTGTGTFMTRLLQSGLIGKKDMSRKYQHEMYANEIVLLAYYIAAVNIENAYHDVMGETSYKEFAGICLTDTFQLGESDDSARMFSEMFPQNSERVATQKKAPLRVIIGNPPYSIGQKFANDNAQNQSYPKLDGLIAQTYAQQSSAGLNRSLYDAYIKAFRWSTDRLDKKNGGIIAFVSNGAWLDGNSTDGFRKVIETEFDSIYVFNLRGNQRTSGELSKKEGGKIFGSGSRTPISITLLVKTNNPNSKKAVIHYYDIGDYLSREEKLAIIKKYKSVSHPEIEWESIKPNQHGDWINQRGNIFETLIPLSPIKKFNPLEKSFFIAQSNGILTAKDSWLVNSSKSKLYKNIKTMLSFYNQQRISFGKEREKGNTISLEKYITYDSTKISWTDLFKRDAENNISYSFVDDSLCTINYRPFNKQEFCYDKKLIQRTYQMLKLFPNYKTKNLLICVSCTSSTKGISISLTDSLVDYHYNGDTQCFPLYYYEQQENKAPSLFDHADKSEFIRRDGISDYIFNQAKKMYGSRVTKENIFYYVYGILHSTEYRNKFANDLRKMLPRLPLLDEPQDFWKYSKAGRALAELHINYESVPPYQGVKVKGADSKFFKVEKMRFPKKDQKDTIIFNSKISISNIPAEAYEYVVNGKSAIEWIMERYQITTHKESGIVNDPNDWAEEVENPRYILDLLLSIINVSVKTVEIVKGLPKLNF